LIRYSVLPHSLGMATLKQKIEAEQKIRELLDQEGMPEPDEVEYGHGCIRLFFNKPKVALVIDIDKPGDDYGHGSHEPDPATEDAHLN